MEITIVSSTGLLNVEGVSGRGEIGSIHVVVGDSIFLQDGHVIW